MVVATQIRRGQVVVLGGDLYKIIKLMHITPGKGNAVVQTDLRNIRTGVKTEKRFRSSEDVNVAYIDTHSMQYLYAEGDLHHFMETSTYEQYEIPADVIAEALPFIVPNHEYAVDVHDGRPIGITLPDNIVLTIVETPPPQKGDTGKSKMAKTDTGLVVRVPLFVAEGDAISVSTADGSYLARA
ncbi:MAG: elongation factor P [Deltaproteobacteria bacterium]|nr:elongation factor P [Deltaproteobacteria bacterium]